MSEDEFEERFRLAFDAEADKPNDGRLSKRVTRRFFHGLGKSIEALKMDPDLIAARDVVRSNLRSWGHTDASIDGGFFDDGSIVQSALAGIKRGRELERSVS